MNSFSVEFGSECCVGVPGGDAVEAAEFFIRDLEDMGDLILDDGCSYEVDVEDEETGEQTRVTVYANQTWDLQGLVY